MKFIKAVLFAPLLSLTACIETSAPVCDASNKLDIPGFDRQYAVSVMIDPAQEIKDESLSIRRNGLGEYETTDEKGNVSKFSTCKVGSWLVSESPTSYLTYSQSLITFGSNGMTSFGQLLLDAKTLASRGVAYEIVERPSTRAEEKSDVIRSLIGKNKEESTKVLVIKGSADEVRAAMVQGGKPGFFMLTAH